MADRKVAIVTGASRGIGRGCALELAKHGYAVVLAARSVKEGMPIEHSSTVKRSDTVPLPGSLETTAREVEELGGEALSVKLDLFERADCDNLIDTTVEKFGRIDVLINNARYIGPGHMDHFIDTPIEVFERHFLANVINPLYLTRRVLDPMIKQGGGIIITVTSGAGNHESAKDIGEGGWGLGYSISKASVNRSVAGLGKEFRKHNIAYIGLEPGFVVTERMTQDMGAFGFDIPGLTTDVPGAVIAYICEHPYPMVFAGKTINGPSFAPEHNLVDGRGFPDPYGPGTWGLPTAPIL